VQGVDNLAVLSRTTGALSLTGSPLDLGGVSNAEVWKLVADGTTVYAAGQFSLSSGGRTYKNLVAFNGTTGQIVSGFRPTNVPSIKAATFIAGRLYVGGTKLFAVDAGNGEEIRSFQASTVATDGSIRAHRTPPQHRDLEFLNGYLYSACQCDSLTQGGRTRSVKALVRFDAVTGEHDDRFLPEGLGEAATGISGATLGGDLYLGAGGSDFLGKYSASLSYGSSAKIGRQLWKRDTSGSTQAVEVSGSDVIIGGHFVEIADAAGDSCGFKSRDRRTLDPDDECQTRNRLASYTVSGALQGWNPSVTGEYNGVWAIALDGARVYIGGEFTRVSGDLQTYYARLD